MHLVSETYMSFPLEQAVILINRYQIQAHHYNSQETLGLACCGNFTQLDLLRLSTSISSIYASIFIKYRGYHEIPLTPNSRLLRLYFLYCA